MSDREEEDTDDTEDLDLEDHWEPLPSASSSNHSESSEDTSSEGDDLTSESELLSDRSLAEEALRRAPIVERFSSGTAGAPILSGNDDTIKTTYQQYSEEMHMSPTNPYAPFESKLDWEIAKWAKLRGPGSTAMTELLKIEGVCESLGLSFKDTDTLNKLIDKLPGRPAFKHEEVVIADEAFEVYHRDVIECIRALYGDPEFAKDLIVLPERHYADADMTIRRYSDMHTGRWWWGTQKALDKEKPGGTIIPVIISSDKTQVTLFGNKAAYPIYMTIGNLPKEIRRKPSRGGHVLLGYLPTTRLDHITNKAARRRTIGNLFHSCVRRILRPLKKAGELGLAMASGDGVYRRVHPIFATFVGDYPEQLLVAGVKMGECPKCRVSHDRLGEYDESQEFRDIEEVLDALSSIIDGPLAFVKACASAGIKPVQHPFWEELPYVNIFQSITPDVLHQLYQGVMKHVIAWVTKACGADEIDARSHRFPPNHNIRLFTKGISKLSKVTGREHAQMCQLLLGLVVDIRLPNGQSTARLIAAVRAILDFCYLAQYPVHSDDTLSKLDEALRQFHDNKDIFVDLGIRNDFNIPKLHALLHYLISIKYFGTTDNYNMEYTERLHIDFAKDAYRATNHKDEYPQMTKWLARREKVLRHEKYVNWRLAGCPAPQSVQLGSSVSRPHLRMTCHPTLKAVPVSTLKTDYGALFFEAAFARFVVQYHDPKLSPGQVERSAENVYLPFQRLPVFHKIKFWIEDPFNRDIGAETSDAVHVRPARQDSRGRDVPARFDTVLVNLGIGKDVGIRGYRVAQVRAVFSLPPAAVSALFRKTPPKHLAYVEWFSPFPSNPDRSSQMYKITRSVRDGERLASIIPVTQIYRSVHLFPKFGSHVPRAWSSSTVLDDAPAFFVNPFLDRATYTMML
ncbi:hypothetical protein NEOLEDRAFT_1074287 [Neolentinus lepideus HHB14362 ss-1]|uniref:Uncharacterized protein n=1 Tax=Neolentinus lepideus HHB14362 ss-1 TaxID=1314782 RepID=A0A165PFD3_9AGAM|nr:hypothetical protein NEOLEDRAFT_1074287 [Neolentinus lepideus HHB14362 ss-1]